MERKSLKPLQERIEPQHVAPCHPLVASTYQVTTDNLALDDPGSGPMPEAVVKFATVNEAPYLERNSALPMAQNVKRGSVLLLIV